MNEYQYGSRGKYNIYSAFEFWRFSNEAYIGILNIKAWPCC